MLLDSLNASFKALLFLIKLNIFFLFFFFAYVPSRVLYIIFVTFPLYSLLRILEGVKILFNVIIFLQHCLSMWKSFCGKVAEVVIALSKLDKIRRKLRKLTPTEFLHFVTQTMLEVQLCNICNVVFINICFISNITLGLIHHAKSAQR